MSKSITDVLFYEHNQILKTKELLERWNGLWEKNPQAFEENIRFLLEFCQQYADKIHHHKEEEILFPALMDNNPMLEQGAIGEMLDHHDMLREHMANIQQYIADKNHQKTYQEFNKYLNLLEDHIAIENDEVFPMSEDAFSDSEKEKLYFQMLDFDQEMASKKHELEEKLNQFLKS